MTNRIFRNIIRRKKATGLVFGLFFSLLLCGPALAEGKARLVISPAYQEVVFDQNQNEQAIKFIVANQTGEEAVIDVSLVDFKSLNNPAGISFPGSGMRKSSFSDRYGLAQWAAVKEPEFAIMAGEKKEVEVVIRNVENLSPGGHYGSALFAWKDQQGAGSKELALNPIISAVILLEKKGGEEKELALKTIDFNHNIFSFPKNIDLNFENSGNVHLVPRGIVTIQDVFGRTAFKSAINQDSTFVFPENSKKIDVALKNLPRFLAGLRYRMLIDYRFDGKTDFARREASFYYFGIFDAIMLLLLTILIIVAMLRCLNYKAREKAKKQRQTCVKRSGNKSYRKGFWEYFS